MKPSTRAIAYWQRHPGGNETYWGCRNTPVYWRDWRGCRDVDSEHHDADLACCWEARLADWTGAWTRAQRSYDDRALWPRWSV